MKKIYTSVNTLLSVFLICLTTLMHAQNYAPFNEKVTKRFYNSANPADNSYFFYADSSHQPVPGTTVFHQYFTLQQSQGGEDVSGCNFWGNVAFYIADTTWLGVEILYDSITQHLVLTNSIGNNLNFDFSLNPGDSSIFYQNSTDKYFIKANQVQSESVYTITDSVKSFTVLHYNMANQPVPSALHQEEIKLGKETGIIEFIDAYNFPLVEKKLQLRGQLNPLIGSYQMQFEDLYPFQAGDSMQYRGKKLSTYSCGYYRTYKVTSRTETTDTVTLTFEKSTYYESTNSPAPGLCTEAYAYPDVLKFPKNSDFLGYPYNKIVSNDPSQPQKPYSSITEDSAQTNCVNTLRYAVEKLAGFYCDSCKCIGPLDAYQQIFPTYYYSEGIGVSNYSAWRPSSGPSDPMSNYGLTLIFYTIDGQTCGNYAWQSISDHELNKIKLYPNPVKDFLTLSEPVDQVNIYSVDGRAIRSIYNPDAVIDLNQLPSGVFIFELRSGDNTAHQRIIKM